MQRLSYKFFILLSGVLIVLVESKKSCLVSTEKRNVASSIRYTHGLFEIKQSNSTVDDSKSQYRNSKIEWIRNVTYQSPFVAVTTYDADVILSEYEYSPIGGLRVVRVTPENKVVWNHTYDLTPQSSSVIVHKPLEAIWFAQFSQLTNSSHLIGLHAINGTVRYNFTLSNYIQFQVDLQSAYLCAVSYDYLWQTPNFTLQCYDGSLPKNQLLWATNLTMADKVSTYAYRVFVSYPAIDSRIKRVYISMMPGYIYQIGYVNNSLMGINLVTGKLLYQNWLYTADHWTSIGHPLASANDDGIVYLSGRTLMAFNGENGTLRFLRARPATYDERVDSATHDTSIININYLGDFTYRQILSLWDGDTGKLLWNISVPNSNFYVNYLVSTTVRSSDYLHLTAQDNVIIGRLPSSNEPVWRFNTSVAQGRVARLGVTNETLYVVVVYYEHQELWKISLSKTFIRQEEETKFSSNYSQCGAYCKDYTDCLLYSCGNCVDNRCSPPDPLSTSCKNEGDCNQMITTCLYGSCRTMWPDCFGQCNSYWTKCYSVDCTRCNGVECES
ncbi:unnamed protein product [Rotaria magnacalcarata]|uniref:Uncharacterized protein n=1 Tax=Rotaria magnacalcarata TaxID=392030 RepID=A0A819M692_9BILA|nr:unnamed protein product [Rotaria magnacalcarata]CAF2169634.1 unnamed protein product [Rotaria magnacalcarata]CAF3855120.1 unnamed protein product [Rotaria magnacalcarata]CAF3974351.1 unnamed protein product [Rotaria magnacalcarata]